MGGRQSCQKRLRRAFDAQECTGNEELGDLESNHVEESCAGGKAASWSSANALYLCEAGEEHVFKGKATSLDRRSTSSIDAAVQALNSKSILCPEGFCVVHCSRRGHHVLLFRRGMKEDALRKLGTTEGALSEKWRDLCAKSRGEFVVVVDKRCDLPLGIDCEPTGRGLCIKSIGRGLIQAWNDRQSDALKLVVVGDCIVECNGKRHDLPSVVQECREAKVLTMMLRHARRKVHTRPPPEVELSDMSESMEEVSTSDEEDAESETQQGDVHMCVKAEYNITIDRTEGKALGITISLCNEDPFGLRIESIDEGLVHAWNLEHPDEQVRVGDCVVEVNGLHGDLGAMVEMCKKHDVLSFTIQERTGV